MTKPILLGWGAKQWEIARVWALDTGRTDIPPSLKTFFERHPDCITTPPPVDAILPFHKLQAAWVHALGYDPQQ